MKKLILRSLILSLMALSGLAIGGTDPTLRLYPGYKSKVLCSGKLQLSSVGNDQLVQLEALPAALGCGVFLRPLSTMGRTNLILETSSGSVERIIEIRSGALPALSDLATSVGGDSK